MNPTSARAPIRREKFAFWRVATAICVSLTALMALVTLISALNAGSRLSDHTFNEYWAAGQLLVHRENPYGFEGTLQLERSLGANWSEPLVIPNPPIILGVLAPLGFLDAKAGAMLWLILLSAGLAASIWIVWDLNGRRRGGLHLLSLCFVPILYCLAIGQIGIFLLLSILLFLWLHRSHPFLAGAALAFCMVKPHLFLPFGVALTLWVFRKRSYRLLGGFAVALLAASAVAFWFDPHAWSHWVQSLRLARPEQFPVPTLSRELRAWLMPGATWLGFLPDAIACAWAIWYFRARQDAWNWMDHGMLLLIVSAGCAPYSWITDEALLLPAVLAGGYRAQQDGRSLLPLVLIFFVELIELIAGATPHERYFLWTVPAYLAWYLYSTQRVALRLPPTETSA